MKAPTPALRLLLAVRRAYESGAVRADEQTRRDMVAKLTEVIEGLPSLTPDEIATHMMTLKEFGRNFSSTMKRHASAHGNDTERWQYFCGQLGPTAEAAIVRTYEDRRRRLSRAAGGRNAGDRKRKDARARWRGVAEQLVKAIVAENDQKKWSKLALVDEIKERWTGDAGALPGDKTLQRMITEMITEKEISLDR